MVPNVPPLLRNAARKSGSWFAGIPKRCLHPHSEPTVAPPSPSNLIEWHLRAILVRLLERLQALTKLTNPSHWPRNEALNPIHSVPRQQTENAKVPTFPPVCGGRDRC